MKKVACVLAFVISLVFGVIGAKAETAKNPDYWTVGQVVEVSADCICFVTFDGMDGELWDYIPDGKEWKNVKIGEKYNLFFSEGQNVNSYYDDEILYIKPVKK